MRDDTARVASCVVLRGLGKWAALDVTSLVGVSDLLSAAGDSGGEMGFRTPIRAESCFSALLEE